jgi:hypothetical protein
VPSAIPTWTCAGAGRIVYPVTRHRNDVAFGLQPLYHGGLLLGRHFGFDLLFSNAAPHGARRGAIVAGKHQRTRILI